MITPITRNELIKTKHIIGSELAQMQQLFHDEEVLQLYKDDGEEHLYWEQFDCLTNKTAACATVNKIIGLDHTDINTFTVVLTEKLTALFGVLQVTDLILVAHLKQDFFGDRDNTFGPLVRAYAKLEKMVGGKTFKEAFTFDSNNLADVMDILFWVTRCDPAAPEYIFLFDKDEQMQLQLCKYGNLHLREFHEERLAREQLAALGFKIIEGRESDPFTKDGKVKGRQIKIG